MGVLPGATNPGQSEPWSDGNEELLRIPQSSSITVTSPSDYLESYPFAEMQSVYSTAPADFGNSCVKAKEWTNTFQQERQIIL